MEICYSYLEGILKGEKIDKIRLQTRLENNRGVRKFVKIAILNEYEIKFN